MFTNQRNKVTSVITTAVLLASLCAPMFVHAAAAVSVIGVQAVSSSKTSTDYKDLGQVMNQQPTWSVYVITAFAAFEKQYGEKATKKRKLFNGFIETNYYQYFGRKV